MRSLEIARLQKDGQMGLHKIFFFQRTLCLFVILCDSVCALGTINIEGVKPIIIPVRLDDRVKISEFSSPKDAHLD